MASVFSGLLRGIPAELTGRKHIDTETYKEIVRMGSNLDDKFNLVTELKTLRNYTDSIPEPIKQEIREAHKLERMEKSKYEYERTR